MTRCIALILIATLVGVAAPGAAEADFKKTKIAVLDFTLQGEGFETEDMGAIVAEWFITAFVKAGRFDVVERGMINKIVEEQKLAMSGILDDTTATQIGKLLGVQTIISGSVLKLQNILEINARIIDVETASIKAAENVKSTAAVRLQDLVVQMSEKIIKNFPLQGYVVSKSEKRVFIDLGRYAGAKVGMQFVVYKEGEIIRHPKTGEVLDVEQIQTGRVVLRNIRDKLSEGEILEEDPPGAITYGQLVYSSSGNTLESTTPEPPMPPPPIGGRGRLYVDADPDSSRIRILNIGPRYYAGIELDPGSYHVEVSAPGYRTLEQWVAVGAGENKRLSIDSGAMGCAGFRTRRHRVAAILVQPGSGGRVCRPVSAIISGCFDPAARKISSPAARKSCACVPFTPAILETSASVLLGGYRQHASNRLYVDAMSWLCNVLGASGKGQYRATLQTVANGAPNSKLKKYALKNLKKLK